MTTAELARRRGIAAREDLTRQEQADMAGMTYGSWRVWLCENRLGDRPGGFQQRTAVSSGIAKRDGYLLRREPRGKRRLNVPAAALDAIGAERVRLTLDRGRRRLVLEAA